MADVSNYIGNAGLGLGASPGIPVTGGPDALKYIQDVGNQIMLLDNQKNVRLYQQQVNDRNALTNLIIKNQVPPGELDPQYQGVYNEAKKRADDAFMQWKGDFNNTTGYKKYQDAIETLKDVAAHGRSNTTMLQQLNQKKAAETLPWKQKQIQDFMDAQKGKTGKDFWAQVDPYQQLHSFSLDPILALHTTGSGKSYSPDGLFEYDDTYSDYDATRKKAATTFINQGEPAQDMNEWLQQVENYDPNQKKQFVDSINTQLDKYNQARGLTANDSGFAPPIKTVVDQQGNPHIADPVTDFNAKYAIASQQGWRSRTPKFQKDVAQYGLNKDKMKIDAQKLGIEAGKAGAYIKHINALTSKMQQTNDQQKTDIVRMYNDFIDNIKPKGITFSDNKTKKITGQPDAIFLSELPESYQNIAGPIMGMKTFTKKDGTKTSEPTGKVVVGKLEPFIATDNKKPYYLPKYVDSKTGEAYTGDSDFIKSTYKDWRKNGYKGSVDDMFRTLLKTGALEMVLKGQNGTANLSTMYQSAKTLNAAATTKGEENIINPPPSIAETYEQNDNPQ